MRFPLLEILTKLREVLGQSSYNNSGLIHMVDEALKQELRAPKAVVSETESVIPDRALMNRYQEIVNEFAKIAKERQADIAREEMSRIMKLFGKPIDVCYFDSEGNWKPLSSLYQ